MMLEDARLHAHFDRTLVALSAAPSRKRRDAMTRALAAYRARGRFPRNDRFTTRTPFFIDSNGTRCAMAHLIEASGERALVERIATQANNAYIAELSSDAELLAWLAAHGLSVEEAARIQPNYTPSLPQAALSCGGAKATAVVLAHAVVDGGASTPIVERVWGTTALVVGSTVAIKDDALSEIGADRVLVAVDAKGVPVATPLGCSSTTVYLEAGHTFIHVSNDDAAGIILAPDCADRFLALAPPEDAGADASTATLPHAPTSSGCMIASPSGGAPIALALLALVTLRHVRRR
jgi:hypothetical protein